MPHHHLQPKMKTHTLKTDTETITRLPDYLYGPTKNNVLKLKKIITALTGKKNSDLPGYMMKQQWIEMLKSYLVCVFFSGKT